MGKRNHSILNSEEYLKHTYSNEIAPPSDYPGKLAKWLALNVFKKSGSIADFGCGRGDFLDAFGNIGFEPHGFDISPSVEDLKQHNVKRVDFSTEEAPYDGRQYDFVFSKSVIEHLREPDTYMTAIHKSLKQGGKAVVMTPSWSHTYWGPFYIDHTHVTPFTVHSLESALKIAGFKKVKVKYFYQLPILWKFPWLTPLVKLFAKIPIPYGPYNNVPWAVSNRLNKLVRFSKEVMLLAVVEK